MARKRAVLFNLLGYAVDKKHFPVNPLQSVRWTSPKVADTIDRRRVVNPGQARELLEAVAEQGPMGRHLEAFFGCMYHAGLRPSEAVMLTLDELELPDTDDQWGWLYLGDSAPSTGGAWNESGNYGTAPDGRLFRGEAGGLLSDTVYGRTWEKARQTALSEAEAASPLGQRPYDLRHARLSTWLNAGVAPAQVAEWAGNSVPVLLRVYAKCLADSEQTALRRIEEAEPDPDEGRQAQ